MREKQAKKEEIMAKKKILGILVLVLVFGMIMVMLTSCGTIGVSQVVKNELQGKGYPVAVIKIVKEGPNSAGGITAYVSWQNISEKDIKYISFIVVPYNKVNDIVASDIGGKIEARLNSTGPFKPNQMESMAKWSNVWYNYSIDHLSLIGLEITFMDETTINFNATQSAEMFINRSF